MKRLLLALALCFLGVFLTGEVRADHRCYGGGYGGYGYGYRPHYGYRPYYSGYRAYSPYYGYRSYGYRSYGYPAYGYPAYGYPAYGSPYGYGYGSYYRGPGVSLYFRF